LKPERLYNLVTALCATCDDAARSATSAGSSRASAPRSPGTGCCAAGSSDRGLAPRSACARAAGSRWSWNARREPGPTCSAPPGEHPTVSFTRSRQEPWSLLAAGALWPQAAAHLAGWGRTGAPAGS